MKLMTKLLLIHWHYFTHEVIEFEKLNFLTGKNASGKSTVIDALQLVLLGDTSGTYFNKAANGKGERSLMGYLRGELGDDEKGGYNYLRNGRFTSYIVIEFYDEEKKRYFTSGCCFDVYSENDIQKLFFSFDDKFPKNEFVDNRIPMNIKALREHMKTNFSAGHSYTTTVGRDFRTHLYGKMGGLRDSFAPLLKKAVSFNPNVDIQQFISEFVCDVQQTVDISGMQENIRSYKNLEQETGKLEQKISDLEAISAKHSEYMRYKNNEIMYDYLTKRAAMEIKAHELDKNRAEEKNYASLLSELEKKIETDSDRLTKMHEEQIAMNVALQNDRNEQMLRNIEAQIKERQTTVFDIKKDLKREKDGLSRCLSSWRDGSLSAQMSVSIAEPSLTDPVIYSHIESLCMECADFVGALDKMKTLDHIGIIALGQAPFNDLGSTADHIKQESRFVSISIEHELSEIKVHQSDLEKERTDLEKGVYHFPNDVSSLKSAINSRLRAIYKKDVDVYIVAEAVEIKNDRWRNVIEGYLNTQKFYIVVAPEYFRTALGVFNEIKHSGRIYNTGLVDIGKLRKIAPTADKDSLAEEIETDDPDVQLFINYVLGRVHKCDDVQDLKKFRTAVTDEGMLYKNYVVRAMNPKLWERQAIGQKAIQNRLLAVKTEMEELSRKTNMYGSINIAVQKCDGFNSYSETDAERLVSAANKMADVPRIEKELHELQEKYNAIDTSAADKIREKLNILEDDIAVLTKTCKEEQITRGEYTAKINIYQKETIPRLSEELRGLEKIVEQSFDREWVESNGQIRYDRELMNRKTPDRIEQAFTRELTRVCNSKNRSREELLGLRLSYNNKYIMGYDINSEDNDVYDKVYHEFKENKLPEYTERIEDSRIKAFEQFREDFLSRLQYNISEANRQINSLNNALKNCYFGEDSYKFRVIPKPEYKRYYDMIVD